MHLPRDPRGALVLGPTVRHAQARPDPATAIDPRTRILARVRSELLCPQPTPICALAHDLARRCGHRVMAILFYGSCLRSGTSDGLIDFYVVVERYPLAVMSTIGAVAARVLPPNVYYLEASIDGRALRAKMAVISLCQLRRRVTPQALDTTIWARLCQPVALVYARDEEAMEVLVALVAETIIVAGSWAARLGPDRGTSREFWLALLRATYASELRVERTDRITQIYDVAPERYAALLADAWGALGFGGRAEGYVANPLSPSMRAVQSRAWHRRRWVRRGLNALRIIKAAFTYKGGVEYIAWKIERHSRQRLALSAFQRRHPLLAIPSLVWQVIQLRVLR